MELLPRASPRAACRSSKNPGGAVQDARAITTKNKKHTPKIIMKKKVFIHRKTKQNTLFASTVALPCEVIMYEGKNSV